MFDANSRYFGSRIVDAKNSKGDVVKAVKLRRLPFTPGDLTQVKGTDRLDIMAHRDYKDGTRFWHIADANTMLEANDLVRQPAPENPLEQQETKFILVPEN